MCTLQQRTLEAFGVFCLVVATWHLSQDVKCLQNIEKFQPIDSPMHSTFRVLPMVSPTNVSTSDGQKYTIYLRTVGRLGGNLFMYASLFGIATQNKRNGVYYGPPDFLSLFPHTEDPFLESKFDVVNSTFHAKISHSMTGFSGIYIRDVMTNLPAGDMEIHGTFISYKYFDHERREIKRRLTPNNNVITKAKTLFNTLTAGINKSATTFIGVHVRRGDMATNHWQTWGIRLPNQTYFSKAIAYYRKKYGNIHIVVASNDIKWCKKNLDLGNASFSDGKSRDVDLALISRCDHVITTVGTFSWWMGYLSNGDVIYYDNFLRKGSMLGNKTSNADRFPPHWIPIGD